MRGPLVLGAGGRVGTMFRRLAAQGLWPGPEPVWHTRDGREGTLGWDLDRPGLPDWEPLAPGTGVIVLAGRTREDPDAAMLSETGRTHRIGEANSEPATRALDLARRWDLGPVLLCSSASVYGPEPAARREDEPLEQPPTIYGRGKLYMEEDVIIWGRSFELFGEPVPASCCLRIGNVAGADALFGAMAAGPVTLDRLPDGRAPKRAYVGPLALARAMLALLARPEALRTLEPPQGPPEPPAADWPWRAINLAQPGLVGMDDLLRAAGVPFGWRDNPAALPALEMDLARLMALAPLPPATPEGLVAEARLAGWRAWGEAA